MILCVYVDVVGLLVEGVEGVEGVVVVVVEVIITVVLGKGCDDMLCKNPFIKRNVTSKKGVLLSDEYREEGIPFPCGK